METPSEKFDVARQDAGDRREAFIAEYLQDFDTSRAAKVLGVTPQCAYRWLKEPAVREAIREAQEAQRGELTIEKNTILRELALIAFGSIKNYELYLETGEMSDMDEDDARAISEATNDITDTDGGSKTKRKVKMADKVRALELLGKYHALWTDKAVVAGEGGNPVKVEMKVSFE